MFFLEVRRDILLRRMNIHASRREKIILPFIIAGVVVTVASGVAAYKKYLSPIAVGRFAIWGREDVGKTTFVKRLLGRPVPAQKEGTSAHRIYKNIPIVAIDGVTYRISEIVDMPGTRDRRAAWQQLVQSHEHIFYLVNIANRQGSYLASVKADLKATRDAMESPLKKDKRLHIVATHVDESTFCDTDIAQLNNVLQKDEDFCLLYESIGERAGYVYAVNLTNEASFRRLIESVLIDSQV